MARKRISRSARVGSRIRLSTAGVAFDCCANSLDGETCARRIAPLIAGSFSVFVDAGGADTGAFSFLAGFQSDGDVQNFTCSVACLVYY